MTGSRASGPGCAQHPCGASDADARQQSPIHCSGAAECCILCGARISCRKPHGVRPLLPCVPSPPCLVWQQSACAEGRASHTGAGTRDGLERGRSRFGESELQQAHCTNCEAAPPGSQHAGLMPTWSQPRKSKSPASASIALRSGCAPVVGILLLLGSGPGKHLPFQTRYTKTKIVYSSLGPARGCRTQRRRDGRASTSLSAKVIPYRRPYFAIPRQVATGNTTGRSASGQCGVPVQTTKIGFRCGHVL